MAKGLNNSLKPRCECTSDNECASKFVEPGCEYTPEDYCVPLM